MPKNQESKKEKSKKKGLIPSFLKFNKSKKKEKDSSKIGNPSEEVTNNSDELGEVSVPESQESTPNESENKTILLIGSTGKGKSTLANVVTGTNEFKESSGSTSETREIKKGEFIESNSGVSYAVIDTVGIGDTKLKHEVVLDKLAEAVYLARDGISQVFFVINGRLEKYEMANYHLLKATIFDEEVVNYTTIVRTRFDNFKSKEECEKDKQALLDESDELRKIIDSCQGGIVYVNNPSLNLIPVENESEDKKRKREEKIAIRKEERVESRKILLKHLNKSCQEIYNPDNLKQLNKEIADDYFQYLEKKRELAAELEKLKTDTVSIPIKIQDNVSKVSNETENKSDSVPKKGKELIRDDQESKTEDIAVGKIKELEDKRARLNKEIAEKERVIRQKVMKHIFNKYDGITKELGGNIFLDSVAEDDNDWETISKEFAEKKLVLGWKSEGFDYHEVQKWSKALGNFNPQNDIGFCSWIRDTKKLTVEEIKKLDYPRNINKLREEYAQQLEKETEILDKHNQQLKQEEEEEEEEEENLTQKRLGDKLKKIGFDDLTAKQWIEVGLEPNEYVLVTYAIRKGYNPSTINIKKLKEEWSKENFTIQGYLNWQYPSQGDKGKVKGIYFSGDNEKISKAISGEELDLSEYPNLEEVDICGVYLKSRLTKLTLGQKLKLTYLKCSYNRLTSLDCSDCPQLEEINCGFNELLNNLILNKHSSINDISCEENSLTNLNFLNNLVSEKLETLELENNNFSPSDLTPFSRFVNLESLELGTYQDGTYIKENIYNRFFGSLEPLKNLTQLKNLSIRNTDIDSGLEYLPDSIESFYCSASKRPESGLKTIETELRKFGEPKRSSSFDGDDWLSNFTSLLKLWKQANSAKLDKEEQSQLTVQIEIPPN